MDKMKICFVIVVLLAVSLFGGCLPASEKKDDLIGLAPETSEAQSSESSERRVIYPSVTENDVRLWFKALKFKGLHFSDLWTEFHPDDGSLQATYFKGDKRLIVTYVDQERLSRFGIPRNAAQLASVGLKAMPRTHKVGDFIWYSGNGYKPLLAVDVSPRVKVMLLGYSGLSIADLVKLAEDMKLEMLVEYVKKKKAKKK